MQELKLKIYFDGSCGNDSKLKAMGGGNAIFLNGELVTGKSYAYGCQGTSNRAEYLALINSLETTLKLLLKLTLNHSFFISIKIIGDSQIVVRQMEGIYKVKDLILQDLYEEAKILEAQIRAYTNVKSFSYHWVRRNRNTIADEYSKEGERKNY